MGIQRARILDAMVQVVGDRGYAAASVSVVSARAKVSRRTFYETFDSLEECFLAVLDEGAQRAKTLISEAFDGHDSWLDGVRHALAALLSFFDAERAFAHVLLIEATAAGPRMREHRELHVAAVTALIERRWRPQGGSPHPLDAFGVMLSLLGVLHTHQVIGGGEPSLTLLGAMMGLVTAPYLPPELVAREVRLGQQLAQEMLACDDPAGSRSPQRVGGEVPDLMLDPRAYRARMCLLYLAEHPGSSNRQVARGVGIPSDSHISTLLAQLHRMGLLVKHAGRPGTANKWSPSAHGAEVARALRRSHNWRWPDRATVLEASHNGTAVRSMFETLCGVVPTHRLGGNVP